MIRVKAVFTTIIAKFLSTLLHLAGYFFKTLLLFIIYDNNNNFSYMKDKCCRHKRLLSHDCVKCIKYKDSNQLKLSMLIEVKCIHGNDCSKCEKCSIQDT